MFKIMVSHSELINTEAEYGKLKTYVDSWDERMVELTDTVTSVDQGEYVKEFEENNRVFLKGNVAELIDEVDLMDSTLQWTVKAVAGLVNRADDFANILKGGEVSSTDSYRGSGTSTTDVAFFDDQFCAEGSHAGAISDLTDTIEENGETEGKELNVITSLLSRLKSISANIDSEAGEIRECITKQNRTRQVYESLCSYADEVKEINDKVHYDFLPFNANRPNNRYRDRIDPVMAGSYKDSAYVYAAIIYEEGMTPEEKALAKELGIKTQSDMTHYREYMRALAGMQGCNVTAYDPVNVNNGNYFAESVDLKVGGVHPIELRRYYNANRIENGLLGKGHTTPFDGCLRVEQDSVKVLYRNGQEGVYKNVPGDNKNLYYEIHGALGTLEKIEEGFKLTDVDGTQIFYDCDGNIEAIGDNNGVHTKIKYGEFVPVAEGSRKIVPVRVENTEGGYFEFSFDKYGYLTSVIDNTGRKVSYEYEVRGEDHLLTAVTFADGSVKKYSYNYVGIIEAVENAKGQNTLYNEYNQEGRIVSQKLANGSTISFEYDEENGVNTVVEPNGNVVEYVSDTLGRNTKISYPKFGVEETFEYNSKNQKISHTDKRGNTTKYTYDNRGHLTGVICPDGSITHYTYYADGKLMSKTDGEGNSTSYRYDQNGNLSSVKDAGGNVTSYFYEKGRAVLIRNNDDSSTRITYDARGNIASVTNPAGITTYYESDDLGRKTASWDELGNRTNYQYDLKDRLVQVTEPGGAVTKYEYDKTGKVEKVLFPDGNSKSYTYTAMGKTASVTDEDRKTTRFVYNESDKRERVILPNGGYIDYEYDLMGNLVSVTDPVGVRTCYVCDAEGNRLSVEKENAITGDVRALAFYEYDAMGRTVAKTDGEGNRTEYKYDRNGNLILEINPAGGKTQRFYDGLGRVTRLIDTLGRTTDYTYNSAGNLIREVRPDGIIIENHYSGGLLSHVTESDGNVVHITKKYTYDVCGRIASVEEQDGHTVSYEYDGLGRVISEEDSNGKVIKNTYDARGRLTSRNVCGNITTYVYTGTGKIKAVIDATGGTTEYSYNLLDQVDEVTRYGVDGDADHVTSYSYDLAGRIIEAENALGFKDIYEYDGFGQMTAHIDRDGNRTLYAWNGNNSIDEIDYADGNSVRFKYNALSILEEVQDKLGVTTYASDEAGRITEVVDHTGASVRYEYGVNDKKTAVIYPDGSRVERSYDSFGNLVSLGSLSDPDGKTDYEYDDYGRLIKKTLPNGVTTEFSYYNGGYLKAQVSSDKEGKLEEYIFGYTDEGQRSSIIRTRRGMDEVSGVYDYEYDAAGRLTEVSRDGDLIRQYEYDSYGNRTSVTEDGVTTLYRYDVLDRLIAAKNPVEQSQYSYDCRGNLISVSIDGLETEKYSFDAANVMTSAYNVDRGKVNYSYNWQKKMIRRQSGAEDISFVLDATRDYSNMLQRTVDGRVEKFVYDKTAVEMATDKISGFYLNDELGSTLYMTGTDGCVAGSYAYDEFGNAIDPFSGRKPGRKEKPGYTRNGNILQPFAFTGYQLDDVTGKYFAQARYYDSETGRFISEDIERGNEYQPDTINHYLYCFNDPVVRIDRDGRLSSSSSSSSSSGGEDDGRHDAAWDKYTDTNVTDGCLSGTVDFSGENATGEYVGAVYLLASDGAGTAGHAAIALVKDDGTAEVYSINGASSGGGGNAIDGHLGTYVDEDGNTTGMDYSVLVTDGTTLHDWISNPNNTEDYYTNFIYIPINNEEGMLMKDKAEELRNMYLTEHTYYGVFTNNCNQNVQMILNAAGKGFAPEGFDWFDTMPNHVYANMVKEINNGNYDGYYYGRLYEDADLARAYQCGD